MATWAISTGDGQPIGEFVAPDDLDTDFVLPADIAATLRRFQVGARLSMGSLLALAIGTRPVIGLERIGDDEVIEPVPVDFAAPAPILKSPIILETLGVAVDFAGMTTALDEAEARIIRDLAPLQETRRRRLITAARDIVKRGDAAAIAGFNIQGDKEEAVILAALVSLYEAGGKNALAEIEQQGAKPSKVAAAAKAAAVAYLAVVAAEAARSLVDRLRTAWGSAVVAQIPTGFNADALGAAITAPGERLLADVARRGSSTALGMGRTDVSAANASAIDREFWSAVMDKDTCTGPEDERRCRQLDGQAFAVGEGPQVPNPNCKGGWRCRCLRIAIVKNKAK